MARYGSRGSADKTAKSKVSTTLTGLDPHTKLRVSFVALAEDLWGSSDVLSFEIDGHSYMGKNF